MDKVREDRLSRRRERERVRRASETPEEWERQLLSASRQRDRARCAATRFMISLPNYTCSLCSPHNALHFSSSNTY